MTKPTGNMRTSREEPEQIWKKVRKICIREARGNSFILKMETIGLFEMAGNFYWTFLNVTSRLVLLFPISSFTGCVISCCVCTYTVFFSPMPLTLLS
jgi:hypothetical protein